MYARWITSKKRGRGILVIIDGIVAGVATAILTSIMPFSGEPSVSSGGAKNWAILLAVMAVLGAANSICVYTLIRLRMWQLERRS